MIRPLESAECIEFVNWLETQNQIAEYKKKPKILFSKLTQDYFINLTGIRKAKYLAKQTREGKRKGIPDYLLLIPQEISIVNRPLLYFIEMKRENFTKSEVKVEQSEFIEALRQVEDVDAYICGGAKIAIERISMYLNI